MNCLKCKLNKYIIVDFDHIIEAPDYISSYNIIYRNRL